jgi:hypothetical protein
MSRSYRKTPITGIAGSKSEKWYKRFRAKRERAKVRELLAKGLYELLEVELCPWDEWDTGRDGKQWFDPLLHPKLMRK